MRSLIIALLGISLGCTAMEPEPIGGTCTSSSECASDELCRLDFCVLNSEVVQNFGFRLVPPNTSMLQPQSVPPAEVSSDEPISIALIPSVRVAGRLLFVNDQNQVRSDGPLGILSLERSSSTTRSSRQQRLDTDSRFDLFVLPGTYTLTFVPDDAETPPKVWSEIALNLDTDPQLTIPARRLAVSGTVLDQPFNAGRLMGLGRARVVALSDRGAASTVGETDDSGAFRIYLLPDSHTYGLRVTFEDEGSTFEVSLKEALECSNTRCVNLLGEDEQFLVQLGSFMTTRIRRKFQFEAAGEDLSGSSVEFTATYPWGAIRLRHSVDVTNSISVNLPNGDWTVHVKPPADSALASTSYSLRLLDDNVLENIALSQKLNVSLEIIYAGSPVPQSRVEFKPTRGDGDGLVLTTDEDGRLDARLDPDSVYRVLITPGLSAAPRTGLVASASSLSSATKITVPRPTVVWGHVFEPPGDDDVWTPIQDVTVQVFELRDGESLTLGESSTRENGQFKILVPASKATLE